MTKRKTILLTLIVWLVAVVVYGYWYVTSILADPTLVGYERWPMFPVLGFFVDRFIYLFFCLLVVIYGEALLFELFSGSGRKHAKRS